VTQAANREYGTDIQSIKNYSLKFLSVFQTSIIADREVNIIVEIIDELNDIRVKEQFTVGHFDLDFEGVLLDIDTDTFLKLGSHVKSFNMENDHNELNKISDLLKKKKQVDLKIVDVDQILDGNPFL
jgi:hypothetical protein